MDKLPKSGFISGKIRHDTASGHLIQLRPQMGYHFAKDKSKDMDG